MDLSPIGRAALVAREGERLTAYKDSVGVWTIGVGITTASGLIKVVPGLKITAEQSDALFAKAVVKYVAPVATCGVRLEQHEFDALVSLCFNIGPTAFLRSTVLRKLRAGDRAGAAEAILMWNRPAEIISRRQAEYDQFRTPYSKAQPKARRSDAKPVKAPSIITTPPIVTTPPPATALPDNLPAAQPAPTGGLSSAPSPAPAGGWFGRLISTIRTNMTKGA